MYKRNNLLDFKSILLMLVVLGLSANAVALKVDVKNLPDSPPFMADGKCVAAFACLKKGSTDVLSYDDKVWGNPKFLPTTLRLIDGTELSGKVAIFNRINDWKFLKRFMFFVPEGETDAYFVSGGEVLELTQQGKKKTISYDAYGDIYLQRLVSGPLRLSFNPAAGTTNKITEFVHPNVLEEARAKVAKETIKDRLKAGKSLNESIEAGKTANEFVTAISAIDITQKEYLLNDTKARKTLPLTEATYQIILGEYITKCSAINESQGKDLLKKYKKIQEAVIQINNQCF